MCLYSQEVEELKTELEVYEKRLESKYKAIAILRKQVGYVMIMKNIAQIECVWKGKGIKYYTGKS